VLADELAPGTLAAAWGRWRAVAAEHLADGEVGAAVAESEEFALDAAVAPVRVLAGEARDELVEFAGSRTLSARSPAVGCPLSADELAVPAEEGLRTGQEGEPRRPGRMRLVAERRMRSEGRQRGRPTWRSRTRS
jgi:hypothetical protein